MTKVTKRGTTPIISSGRVTGPFSVPHRGKETTTAGTRRASPRPSHIIKPSHSGPGDSSASSPPGTALARRIHHSATFEGT